jgi:hypothetical protein
MAKPETESKERIVPKDFPDHHDAELILRLYELRREPVLREARRVINLWFPKTFEDFTGLMKPDHPDNAAFRQVNGYWDMVFGMARHGVINGEFLMENSGEGLFFYSRVERFLEEIRKLTGPRAFRNAEWVANNTEFGREIMPRYRQRVDAMIAG